MIFSIAKAKLINSTKSVDNHNDLWPITFFFFFEQPVPQHVLIVYEILIGFQYAQ